MVTIHVILALLSISAVEDVDHHEDRYRNAAAEVMGQQSAEPPEDAPQHPDLQQHQQQHQPEAAENRVDDPLLALFQEPEAAVLELLHPVFHVLLKSSSFFMLLLSGGG